jgi:hypothetical protein
MPATNSIISPYNTVVPSSLLLAVLAQVAQCGRSFNLTLSDTVVESFNFLKDFVLASMNKVDDMCSGYEVKGIM